MSENENNEEIVLEGPDGQSYRCQLLDVFTFEEREYGLLLKAGAEQKEKEEDDESLLIMRLEQNGDETVFQTIEDDDEFERVCAFVEQLAEEEGGDEDEGDGEEDEK